MIGYVRLHSTLRCLLAPDARLWLVRPGAAKDAAGRRIILLHALPGVLVGLGAEVAGHG